MIRRSAIVLGALAVALALFSGCKKESGSGGNASPSSRSQSGQGPAEVRLGYFANLTHAQAVLGTASGDFEQAVAPAKFSTKVFNAGPSLIEALFAGEIDIGYVGPGPAISAHGKSRGQGIRIVSGSAANGVLIIARSGSGIEKLEDLKRKKIATPQLGNTQDIAARHYVMTKLGQADANNVLPIANAEQAAMMSRGQIDAAWTPEPWATRLVVEAGGKIIGDEKDLWPKKEVTLTTIVTTPEFLKKHPEVVSKVLGVNRDWTKKLAADPQKYTGQLGEALFTLTGKRLPAGVPEKAITNVKFTEDPLEETLAAMAQWSFDLGMSREQTPITGLVDLSLLKALKE